MRASRSAPPGTGRAAAGAGVFSLPPRGERARPASGSSSRIAITRSAAQATHALRGSAMCSASPRAELVDGLVVAAGRRSAPTRGSPRRTSSRIDCQPGVANAPRALARWTAAARSFPRAALRDRLRRGRCEDGGARGASRVSIGLLRSRSSLASSASEGALPGHLPGRLRALRVQTRAGHGRLSASARFAGELGTLPSAASDRQRLSWSLAVSTPASISAGPGRSVRASALISFRAAR